MMRSNKPGDPAIEEGTGDGAKGEFGTALICTLAGEAIFSTVTGVRRRSGD